MPRTISLDWREDCQDRLQMTIQYRMKKFHKTQSYMADLLGITQQAFSYKLAEMNFKWIELVQIFEELQITPIEVGRLSERR